MGAEILLPDDPPCGDGEEACDLVAEGGSAAEPPALHVPKQQHLVAEVDDFFGLVLKLAQFGNPLPVVAEASLPLPTAIDRIWAPWLQKAKLRMIMGFTTRWGPLEPGCYWRSLAHFWRTGTTPTGHEGAVGSWNDSPNVWGVSR
jgi:hypothetical protein